MTNPPKPTGPSNPSDAAVHRPRLSSEELLQGASAVEIEHAGQRYFLRITRENKLILTK